MRIRFVKREGATASVYLHREGAEVSWRAQGGPGGVPHDLVHHVVESALGIDDGFWGLVARGVDFGFLYDAGHSARGPRAGEPEVPGLVRAEEIVNAVALAALVDQAAGVPELDEEQAAAVRERVRAAAERWHSLASGESLTLVWPARP